MMEPFDPREEDRPAAPDAELHFDEELLEADQPRKQPLAYAPAEPAEVSAEELMS